MKTLELPSLVGSRNPSRPQRKRAATELTPTKKTAVVGALLLALGLTASWFVVLKPRAADVAAVQEQTAAALSANDSLRAQIAARRVQAAQLPTLAKLSDALSARFPATAEQAKLFSMIGAAAAGAGIAPQFVTNLTVAAPVDASGATTSAGLPGVATPIGRLASQQLTMDVRAKPDQIRKFVANLEKLPRAFQVTSLNLNLQTAAAAGTAGTVAAATAAAGAATSAQITGTMFLMPEFAVPPQPAAPPAPAQPNG
ncbi:MAG: hypothetical protein ACT4QG_07840 [Sporichthyaceae bacterium]